MRVAVFEQQQKLCHFKPGDRACAVGRHQDLQYVPPRPPEPMTRRRMLQHNAIEAWETMQKTGWRRCPPPVDEVLSLSAEVSSIDDLSHDKTWPAIGNTKGSMTRVCQQVEK